jgi:hypothetical protein
LLSHATCSATAGISAAAIGLLYCFRGYIRRGVARGGCMEPEENAGDGDGGGGGDGGSRGGRKGKVHPGGGGGGGDDGDEESGGASNGVGICRLNQVDP